MQWVQARQDCRFSEALRVFALPARHFWDADYFRRHLPGVLQNDERPGASPDHVVWAGDKEEAGWHIHSYQSLWLPRQLLDENALSTLAGALFAASRHWGVQLHFNKGMVGASPATLAACRDTAANPNMLGAFALAIVAGGGAPAYPGMPGRTPNAAEARADAQRVGQAMAELKRLAPDGGAYVSESDFFQPDWQDAYWGSNYARLAAVKRQYDPHGLFFVHHGAGSEAWSADGFTPLAS
ncbi:BBE domain-containing protein [Massilia sp. NR 4-1]|uniref:BBE domain-containing protein n=1 Tax=Massilia sp. NR 4-1 TaxID=1678028 RepID=UPI00067D644E|nr:BBE domain-containing protein [Massilia sp. NR 4-1]